MNSTITPEQKFKQLYEQMYRICQENNWGDPFQYARSKEIYAANELNHTVASDYSGADAHNGDKDCEYKSTVAKNCQGSYTGISVQPTWAEQVIYLKEKKIAKYDEHYYNRFDKETGLMVESWVMPGKDVLRLLLPKLKLKYPTVLNKKDPRLSANITWSEIQKYGKRVK